MSSASLAGFFAILGTGLAVLSAASVTARRRAHRVRRARDEWSGRLDELAGKQRALEARLARVEAATAAAASAVAVAIASHPAGPKLRRRVDPGGSSSPAGPTLISVPDLATPPSQASTSAVAAELDRRFGPVWAMADEGAAVDAIARQTGYPSGQVELILGLRRRLLVAEAGLDA